MKLKPPPKGYSLRQWRQDHGCCQDCAKKISIGRRCEACAKQFAAYMTTRNTRLKLIKPKPKKPGRQPIHHPTPLAHIQTDYEN